MKSIVSGGTKQNYLKGFMKVSIVAIRSVPKLSLIIILGLGCFVPNLFAQAAPKQTKNNNIKVEAVKKEQIKPISMVSDFFGDKISVRDPIKGRILKVIEENELSEAQLKKEEEAKKAQAEKEEKERQAALGRTSADAPEEFKGIVTSLRLGNIKGAEKYADGFVDYMMNLMFEVRQITDLIGKALVKRGTIEEDGMVGVGQYLDISFAEARNNNYDPLKPTHQEAMKRIKGDPKNQAEIYYFFTLSCSYCRSMAADVERLWRVVQGDKNLKMVALSITPTSKGMVESYRQYTGLSVPIYQGEKTAKGFNIAFIPAMVVVSPNNNVAYLKSGEQDFTRMYEFVRTVQGLPATLSADLQKLIQTPIGEVERKQSKKGLLIANKTVGVEPGAVEAKVVGYQGSNNSNAELSRF